MKAGTWSDICIPIFIAALFTIANQWKQSKCPSTDEWMNRVWYRHITRYYSALKRKEILTHATMWMHLKDVILSEMSVTKEQMLSDTTSPMWRTWSSRIHKERKQYDGCQGLEGGEMGSYYLMNAEFQFGLMENYGDGWLWYLHHKYMYHRYSMLQMHLLQLNYTLKLVKMVNFMLCIFYHNLKSEK